MTTMSPTKNLKEAIAQGFVVVKSSYNVLSTFSWYCRENNLPCVTVRPRTKYAQIDLNLDTTTYQLTPRGRQAIGQVLAVVVPEKYRFGMGVMIGNSFSLTRWVPLVSAREVARVLVDIAQTEGNISQKIPPRELIAGVDVIDQALAVVDAAWEAWPRKLSA